ncbi:MAG TPA: ROK family transcriptional regulator [Pyrinomonadaceae bacterium]|jgi:predicted NBD/HSP70 family sugar kinase|nr:ROK family transcriptional regulator [Pyrinomonadaceae bacterium]
MRRIDLRSTHAAHSSNIRNINRQIVLNYVRDRGPISRAEIARQTALQRSTVSDIVDSLITDELVEEIGVGQSTGGRCPTLLKLQAGAAAIGIDIAPTRTTVAMSDLAGCVLATIEFETDHDFEATIARVTGAAGKLLETSTGRIEGIGVSLPGLVDPCSGKALYIPYFNWRDLNIGPRIAAATGLPVVIENDANAAALAELWFGQPEVSEARDFIMVFIAEGVGTGIIFDRQIYRGRGGTAGEFGHMIIGERAPVPCSCGSYNCWEAFASGRAAIARYLKLSGKTGGAQEMDFARLIDLALCGEEAAQVALCETARYLGVGISNLIIGFSPDIIVVGGAITRAWTMVSDVLGETVEGSIRRNLQPVHIIASTIGGQASLMGALSLVLANKFSSVAAL